MQIAGFSFCIWGITMRNILMLFFTAVLYIACTLGNIDFVVFKLWLTLGDILSFLFLHFIWLAPCRNFFYYFQIVSGSHIPSKLMRWLILLQRCLPLIMHKSKNHCAPYAWLCLWHRGYSEILHCNDQTLENHFFYIGCNLYLGQPLYCCF